MGFLDIFLEIEPSDKKGSSKTVPKLNTEKAVAWSTNTASASITPSHGISSEDMGKFNVHFDELFEKANLPGPDYFEFTKMCQAMASLPEDTKFPVVFTGLQVQGLSKEKLVNSAKHYIDIIDEDSRNFNNTIDSKIFAEIEKKKQAISSSIVSMEEKKRMISQLQQEVEKQNNDIITMQQDVEEQGRSANEKSVIYKTVCDMRKASIVSDVEKIQKYVK